MKHKKSVSIVMLVYNEAEIIEKVIREYYDSVFLELPDAEFIIAEDGSNDGTKEILKRLNEELNIRLVSGDARKGYVKAYRDSIKLPIKDVIFFTDSSGKQYPEDFWDMYSHTDDYEIVSGYKVKRRDPFYRIVITKMFNALVNLYYGTHFKDIDSGFKLIDRKAMLDVLGDDWICTDLISFETMIRLAYRGYKIKEVPVRHRPRENGSSRGLPLKKIPKVVKMVLSNFRSVKFDAKRCAHKSSSKS
ncbi:MAG: glycosyltransferase family 2 protein [Clostridia bacterium]